MDDLQYIADIENVEIAAEPVQRHNHFQMMDAFDVLNERQFVKIFRLTKNLCRILIETLSPYMRPQRRTTDLRITTRVCKK